MGGGEGISRGRGVIIGSLRHLKLGLKKKKKKKNVGLPTKNARRERQRTCYRLHSINHLRDDQDFAVYPPQINSPLSLTTRVGPLLSQQR